MEQNNQASFNTASLAIIRLNELLNALNKAIFENISRDAIYNLRLIYKEIYPKLNPTERTKVSGQLSHLAILYRKLMIEKRKSLGLLLWAKIDEVDYTLRDLLDKKCLLIPNKTDQRSMLNDMN